MSEKEELEAQMTGPLSAALVTIATFSLTVMGLVNAPERGFVDEAFMFLGLASLLSAARIIDARFDKVALKVTDRIDMIGGGYFFFCLVIGGMSFAILVLNAAKNVPTAFPWRTLLPALLVWTCITGKLMSHNGSVSWFVGALVGFVAFLLVRP